MADKQCVAIWPGFASQTILATSDGKALTVEILDMFFSA